MDSAPYSYAFPYRIERASIEHGKLYFSRHVEGEGKLLFVTDWDTSQPIALNSETATKVTDLDLNEVNFWGRAYNHQLGGLVVEADDDKAERINLWAFVDGEDAPRQMTDVDYVYEFDQSPDHSKVYYTARYGASDANKGCLEEMTLQLDGPPVIRQLICDDEPAMPARINWWTNLRADNQQVIFPALKDGDRNKQELYAYDLSDGTVSLLFEGHGTGWLSVRHDWGDETQALFTADRDLYRYDFESKEAILVHSFERSVSGFEAAGTGVTPPIIITTETPFETKMEVLRVEGDEATVLSETLFAEDTWLADNHDGTVFIGRFSPEVYADFEFLNVTPDGQFTARNAIEGLDELNAQLAQCNVERVKIDYEDTNPATPGPVSLDVFLYLPKEPRPIDDQKFIITAYYGGENEFSSYHHIYCALGITTVSPAVRGDWRFGTEFANANDREGADAPIRDTYAVARYLIERFDIPSPRQIGTVGYSHGGWAAVRAVSYPGPERMDLGFAIAGGGFYDVLAAVDPTKNYETNIHGWFDKEFGTLEQPELLRFLSPSEHVEGIDAAIFLYHGARDSRISINQSLAFAAQLVEQGTPHELMELSDYGHSIRGTEIWAQIRQQILNFLAEVP